MKKGEEGEEGRGVPCDLFTPPEGADVTISPLRVYLRYLQIVVRTGPLAISQHYQSVSGWGGGLNKHKVHAYMLIAVRVFLKQCLAYSPRVSHCVGTKRF